MPLDVDLSDILDGHFRARMDEVHTAIPARVLTYDPASQTVDVQPTVKRVAYDENGARADEALPVIPHVPVAWPGGGGFFVALPLAAGDHVLVVFAEGATGDWRTTGNAESPSDTTRHGLNGAFAIPCVRPDGAALKDASATELRIGQDGTSIQIAINGTAISLGKGATDHVALATPTAANFAAIVAALTSVGATTPDPYGVFAAFAAAASAVGAPQPVAATLVKAK